MNWKTTIIKIGIMLLAIYPITASAQDTDNLPSITDFKTVNVDGRQLLQIPLKDVLYWALQRSGDIRSARMDIDSARSRLIAEMESSDMTLTNNITQGRALNLAGTNLNGSSDSPYLTYNSANSLTRSSQLSKKDSNGILYSLKYSSQSTLSKLHTIEKQGASSNESDLDDELETSALTFGVSVPLFKGWGNVNQTEENKSRVRVQQAEWSTEQTKLTLLNLIADTYWNLVGLWEKKRVAQKAVELSEKLYAENKERAKLGILKLIEVKQTAIQLNRNKLTVLDAERSIREVEDQLKILLGVEDIPYGFIPSETPSVQAIEDNIDTMEEAVLKHSPELGLIEGNLEINRLDTEKAVNDDATDLDLDLAYTLNGAGDSISSGSDGWSDRNLNTYSVGITWTIPLGDKRATESIHRKRLEQAQLDIQKNDTRSKLRSELRTLVRSLDFARENITTNEEQYELAEQILNEEIEKMKLGKSRSYLVSEAQQDQIEAKLGVINAQINYEKTYFSILLKTGKVYQAYRLQSQDQTGE